MLTVTYKGREQVDVLFSRLEEVANPEVVLDEAGAHLVNRIRTRFLDQRSPDGIQWIPSISALRREAEGLGGGTLFDTGALFHSIQLYRKSPEVRAISTDIPYALEHQAGIGQEVRVFLGFSRQDTSVVQALIRKRLEGVTS